ncbi:tRNA (adenine(22)-N(1))-methyltransferase TrmK [Psychromonas sp.]|nr:tRNA (adenine(22)-N(1))-methyltransferase TrmK [Psychromonas sp.]
MKLSKRLSALSKMVKAPYKVVWDCCCDHGLLGFEILAKGKVKQVNFVDVVPEIMNDLEVKLLKYGHHLPSNSDWKIFCEDVCHLNLIENINEAKNSEQPQHLVIISGVGGDLIIEMLESLCTRYAGYNIDYLLCPVLHTYKLRRTLVKLNFNLKEEQLIIENRRGYELLLVNQQSRKKITLTGDYFGQDKLEHEQYLLRLIQHYERVITLNNEDSILNHNALRDYQNVYRQNYKK